MKNDKQTHKQKNRFYITEAEEEERKSNFFTIARKVDKIEESCVNFVANNNYI